MHTSLHDHREPSSRRVRRVRVCRRPFNGVHIKDATIDGVFISTVRFPVSEIDCVVRRRIRSTDDTPTPYIRAMIIHPDMDQEDKP